MLQVCRCGWGHGPRLDRGGVTAARSPTGSCSTTCSPPWSTAAVTSASPPQGGSDRTIRRRLLDWAERDVGVELLKAALAAYDQMIGFDLDDLSWMGRSQNRPAEGNFRVGPRSIAVSKAPNARWSPTGAASPSPSSGPAPTGTTHRCTNPMRQIPDMIGPLPDQPCVHLDRGYDSTPTPGPARRTRLRPRDRPQTHPRPHPSRETVGRGTHPFLG